MGREVGTFVFSANFEVTKEGTLDARQIVDNFDDLLVFNSGNFIPNGFPVAVRGKNNADERGLYVCMDNANLNQAESWAKITSNINLALAIDSNGNNTEFKNNPKDSKGFDDINILPFKWDSYLTNKSVLLNSDNITLGNNYSNSSANKILANHGLYYLSETNDITKANYPDLGISGLNPYNFDSDFNKDWSFGSNRSILNLDFELKDNEGNYLEIVDNRRIPIYIKFKDNQGNEVHFSYYFSTSRDLKFFIKNISYESGGTVLTLNHEIPLKYFNWLNERGGSTYIDATEDYKNGGYSLAGNLVMGQDLSLINTTNSVILGYQNGTSAFGLKFIEDCLIVGRRNLISAEKGSAVRGASVFGELNISRASATSVFGIRNIANSAGETIFGIRAYDIRTNQDDNLGNDRKDIAFHIGISNIGSLERLSQLMVFKNGFIKLTEVPITSMGINQYTPGGIKGGFGLDSEDGNKLKYCPDGQNWKTVATTEDVQQSSEETPATIKQKYEENAKSFNDTLFDRLAGDYYLKKSSNQEIDSEKTYTEIQKLWKGAEFRSNGNDNNVSKIFIDENSIEYTVNVGGDPQYNKLTPNVSGLQDGETKEHKLPNNPGTIASSYDRVNQVRLIEIDINNDTVVVDNKDYNIMINSTDGTAPIVDMTSELPQSHGRLINIRANARVDFNIPIKDLDGNTFLPNGTNGNTQLDATTAEAGISLQAISANVEAQPNSIISSANNRWFLLKNNNA
ncbi:hypothetical protein [Psychroflexus aestuariivivens]|uniref:hypothetical protein n=1 Tax=Psychroflexus aestuariivivens TaxID=1795040 RepID=UPI000FD76E49|nr:hypothetical protein [Psychroflexus aestuariivivens]